MGNNQTDDLGGFHGGLSAAATKPTFISGSRLAGALPLLVNMNVQASS